MSDRSLLVRHDDTDNGLALSLSPHDAGWTYIGFDLLRLPAGASWEGSTGDREVALVSVAGTARVSSSAGEWSEVGGRASPFDGLPHCLYLPAHTDYRIEARTALELAICGAPAAGDHAAHLYTPDDVHVHIRGDGQCQREIHDMLM